MSKITAGFFISLDGVIENPQDWHFPYFNDEMGAAVGAQLGNSDTLLLGRVTYEGFAGAWPQREDEGGPDSGMAKSLGDARKIVVSHQDLDLPWRNSEQLKGDLIEGVTALKQESTSDIAMSGSPSIVRQLLSAELLDELHLFVHPISLGSGERLFGESEPIPLQLLSATPFQTGVLHLVYGPAAAAGDAGYDEAKVHLPQAE
ncbi:dihydrofolate reductase family protein [Nocardia jejuensis]|uniref:dihydrofolate reductase family protein n=1 Tax=Nocardia jejuensis TaxID=328049 RepID=UPI00082E138E|nr:dihydrofolate reductase family protein [Nocardia jejuensis]